MPCFQETPSMLHYELAEAAELVEPEPGGGSQGYGLQPEPGNGPSVLDVNVCWFSSLVAEEVEAQASDPQDRRHFSSSSSARGRRRRTPAGMPGLASGLRQSQTSATPYTIAHIPRTAWSPGPDDATAVSAPPHNSMSPPRSVTWNAGVAPPPSWQNARPPELPMRVGLSLLTLVPGISGGSETYVRELTRALARVGTHEYVALVPPLAAEFVTAFMESLPEGLR